MTFNKSAGREYTSYFLPVLAIFLFFIFWQGFSSFDLINSALFSSPAEVFRILSGGGLVSFSDMVGHITSTLYRTFFAFFISTLVALTIGILMGLNKKIYKFFDPVVTVFMPVPGIAWAPLFIMWIGLGDPNIIAVGILAGFFPIVYNTATGVRSVDKNLINAARISGLNKIGIIFKVMIPGSLPHIFTGLKLGLARCWRTVIAVEMIAATTFGLGYMIMDASDFLRMSTVYAGIIVLALIYFVMEYGFKSMEKKSIEKWGMVNKVR